MGVVTERRRKESSKEKMTATKKDGYPSLRNSARPSPPPTRKGPFKETVLPEGGKRLGTRRWRRGKRKARESM